VIMILVRIVVVKQKMQFHQTGSLFTHASIVEKSIARMMALHAQNAVLPIMASTAKCMHRNSIMDTRT